MKIPSPFAALIFAVWVAAPSISSAQPVPAPAVTNAIGPRMTFETNNYNFGRVCTGTQVHHTYIVTNTGDQTLVISSVAPGCHCTSAGVVLPMKIEPGQTGQIPIKFDSGGLHGDVTRVVTVTSNGKPLPIQTLYLHGNVWQEIQVIPANAYMTVSPDMDTPASGSVRIVSEGDAPLSILEATSDNRAFKAEFKAARPGKEFTLTVTAQPPFTPGSTVGHIIVKTSSTNTPVLNIMAIANVQQAVEHGADANRPSAFRPRVDDEPRDHLRQWPQIPRLVRPASLLRQLDQGGVEGNHPGPGFPSPRGGAARLHPRWQPTGPSQCQIE